VRDDDVEFDDWLFCWDDNELDGVAVIEILLCVLCDCDEDDLFDSRSPRLLLLPPLP
jgi:hypothetical protein